MLNMLDDCSRLFTGSKLYERELLLSYFDFLPAAFLAHGCPLQLYVDYHSLFFTHDPDALTQLGAALKFYDISLRPAPRCPWWPYVWSVRTPIRVGSDGRVPIGTQRLRLEKSPGDKVILCLHPTGHHSVLAHVPDPTEKPVLLFTNRPK